jgi:hypothetical protein
MLAEVAFVSQVVVPGRIQSDSSNAGTGIQARTGNGEPGNVTLVVNLNVRHARSVG